MRLLLAVPMIALLSAGVGACGGVGKGKGSASQTASSTLVSRAGPTQSPIARSPQGYLNDGDYDRIGDEDGDNTDDVDNDAPWDYKPVNKENARYHDSDDSSIVSYGHAASAADTRAVTAVVKRYYAAAATGDGNTACSMLIPSLVKAMPEDYGELGPAYVRGVKTCQAIMLLLFKHSHSELIAPVTVTGVRILGDHAYALLGSATVRAGYVTLQRVHGAWTINQLLSAPLV